MSSPLGHFSNQLPTDQFNLFLVAGIPGCLEVLLKLSHLVFHGWFSTELTFRDTTWLDSKAHKELAL